MIRGAHDEVGGVGLLEALRFYNSCESAAEHTQIPRSYLTSTLDRLLFEPAMKFLAGGARGSLSADWLAKED